MAQEHVSIPQDEFLNLQHSVTTMLHALDDAIITHLTPAGNHSSLQAIRFRHRVLCDRTAWVLLHSIADYSEVLPIHREMALRLFADAEENHAIIPPDELANLRASLTSVVNSIDSTTENLTRSNTLVDNIRSAYFVLCDRVTTAAQTQVGDADRLMQQREEVLRFLAEVEPHCTLFRPVEFNDLRLGVSNMVEVLDEAVHRSSDPPAGPPIVIAERVRTGRRGRPRVEINPSFLETGLQMRGPLGLAPVFSCSSRTVRRRALEHNLVEPGAPVIQQVTDASGTVTRTHTSTTPPVSTLSDGELDTVVSSILAVFPNFGRRMLAGCLRSQGHRVPRTRLLAAYVRLIRWKLVVHCFIDGWSRYIVGIRVHNNNRAETVLLLFHHARADCGDPSRVHLELTITYLSRSVHNTRVERLWYDFTRGVGQKWKNFFLQLEHNAGLH
ncbi:uncharacterized protein B0H18DRAFT_912789, partial [Fomitopsis serialis]|uniref:uncharacterized protein n=1 Tax=Fomitopsis serialis TaxID=139415 RepID=UPI0020081F75